MRLLSINSKMSRKKKVKHIVEQKKREKKLNNKITNFTHVVVFKKKLKEFHVYIDRYKYTNTFI